MLRFLRIARLAVIDAVEVEFEPGFNVLTGETGAGKSILVEAVGLLLGGRASGELVRTGEDAATVEAIFQRGDHEIVIRRELTAQGRSRAFIDGTLVTAGALKEHAAGCAGCYTAHAAMEMYAEAFDAAGALDKLEAFASFHGPDFYGLPRNTGTLTLRREAWTVPEAVPFGEAQLKPLRGGESLPWRVAA